MDSYIVNVIENRLRQYRFYTEKKYTDELNILYEKYPHLSELEKKKKLLVSDYRLIKEKNFSELNKINNEIKTFLHENKITLPSKIYKCNVCNDNGYIENEGKQVRCKCFEKMLMEESIKNETLNSSYCFYDFDETIFDSSIKNDVIKIKNFLKDYSDVFPAVKKTNIFLSGNTGTGKTFLMSCVYCELKKRGINVLFITAGKLFDILRKYALNQINDIDILLNAEVLLIDDLGSEPMFNNITNEFLFLLINERTRNKMPLFISTNLLPSEIKNHYNERIASRLLDKSITNIISLPGSDLRLR